MRIRLGIMQQILIPTILYFVTVGAAPSEMTVNGEQIVASKQGPVCVSPGCVKAAATVLENLDETVEPCDDFFQFACGGFIKKHTIPEDKTQVNYFNLIGDEILEQLKILLEEPPQPGELKPFVLAKKFYNVCLNTAAIENRGLDTMSSILSKLGGWPVLQGSSWNENNFDWKNTMYEFRKIGFSTDCLLNVFVGADSRNTSMRIIDIDQARLGLEREYLVEGFNNDVVKAYYDYQVDAAVIFGADRETASKEMKEVVEFEIELAKISLPKEERRNATALTNIMSVRELQQKFPFIPWQEYLNNLVAVSGVLVCPNDVVDVGVPKYVNELETLLKKTPNRVQANYLLAQMVLDSVSYLNSKLRNRELKYDAVHDGTQQMEPRWKECTEQTILKFGLATDAMYVRRYFNEEAKKNAEELVSNLMTTFIGMLKEVDWMDDATRKRALEKAFAMGSHIAYPQELQDDQKLSEYYATLETDTDDFLWFRMQIEKFKEDVSFKRLPEFKNKTDWRDHSAVTYVNAYYNGQENSIQLPAGILQDVVFDNQRPNYMNYGSLGFAIGHEITHGFDDQGRQYDKDGTLKDWWAQKTSDAFLEKAQCIIDQYGNYTVPEVNLPLKGINTQGENIADNGGLKEAYIAYNSWVERHGEEPRLPGLKYSQRQLFWISSSNLWCANLRTEFLRQTVLTDYHAPPKYRVLVPLGNTEQFAEDFQCPSGSKMNPEHKCHVW